VTEDHQTSTFRGLGGPSRSQRTPPIPSVYEDFATRLLPADPEIRGGPDRHSIVVEQESLLTVKQLAARLSVCTATIYRLCDRGELPYVRVAQALRFVPMEVAEYMARRRRGPEM
jgi:excisionase family DNA binding protein